MRVQRETLKQKKEGTTTAKEKPSNESQLLAWLKQSQVSTFGTPN